MPIPQHLAEMLYDGAVALRAGDRQRAQDLLLQVVEADDQIAEAWLWLSGAVDEVEDQRTALENVLAIEPNNPHARAGLAFLDRQP